MKQMTPFDQDANSPEHFDSKFHGCLGVTDIERLEKLARFFKGGVYVDVGVNDSPMPIILSERFPDAKIYALDYAPRMMEFMRKRFPKVQYIVADAMQLPFEDESVDYLVAGELIEHLRDPKAFVQEALRVLKKDGMLAISTPFEEKGRDVGGKLHLWSWSTNDVAELMGTELVEVLQEQSVRTILAWRKK